MSLLRSSCQLNPTKEKPKGKGKEGEGEGGKVGRVFDGREGQLTLHKARPNHNFLFRSANGI